MHLSPEEVKALNTPLRLMTPALMALAVSAKEKKAKMTAAENKAYKPAWKKKVYVAQDCTPFTSPVTGEVIGGRMQLREHLKATNCRILEPSETRHLHKKGEQ